MKKAGLSPALFFIGDNLENGYRSVLGDSLYDMELTNYVAVVSAADNKRRSDLGFRVLEIYIFCKMCFAELLVVNDVPVVVLDDQGELLTGWVFELHLENNIVLGSAYILDRYLFVGEGSLLVMITAAICVAGQGIANDNYKSGCCYCDCFYYRIHTITILKF